MSSLCWNGPEWMTSPSSQWPRTKCGKIKDDPTVMEDARPSQRNPEMRALHLTSIEQTSQELQTDPFDRFSSLIKLERSIAWCLRFSCLHQPRHNKHSGAPLTSRELDVAFQRCVYWAQRVAFPREIKRLELRGTLHKDIPLRGLSPFLDAAGMLKVGGRLQESALSYPERHPVILPKRSHLSDLIIDWAHRACLHGGYSLTYAQIVKRAWIVGRRTKTKAFIRRCLRCARTNVRPLTQLMGRLPRERVTAARPYSRTGLDYAGPFYIKSNKGRGNRTQKSYLALFVCLGTKTVHLEVVGDLTMESFLAAVRRFSGRRGVPCEIWSDNATTFRGADSALRAMFREARILWHDVSNHLANQRIQWRFIPPSIPHFGGLLEAAVKSAKTHLKWTVGAQFLTYEELNTVAIQIKRALNSRPLPPLSGATDDLDVLTPGHFLIGTSLLSILTAADGQSVELSRHWHLVQAMYHRFWERCAREYLNTLQQRTKWTRRRPNLKVSDLVLIIEAQLIRHGNWPLGRVIAVHPGPDGLVRSAVVRTASGTYTRPIIKLSILSTDQGPPCTAGGAIAT